MRQTFPDWECIIVDDGSTDNSAELIQDLCLRDIRLRYFYKSNGGVASARNFGLQQARGFYALPLDGDDFIAPAYLEEAYGVIRKNPDVDLIYCGVKLFGACSGVWELPEYRYDSLLYSNMIHNSSVFKVDAARSIGGYSCEMVFGNEDWEFYVRLLDFDSIVLKIDKALFNYRILKSSRSSELKLHDRNSKMQKMIFDLNRDKYSAVLNNPIGVVDAISSQRQKVLEGRILKIKHRYKRQRIFLHLSYVCIVMLVVFFNG